MILPIVQLPNPVLRQKAKPVTKIDKKILKLIKDMTETLISLHNPTGVGLAAPQVGQSLRLFIVDINTHITPFINPEIIEASEEKALDKDPEKKHFLEGCLSLKHVYGFVNRNTWIKIKYQNTDSLWQEKIYKGRIAEYLQHEMDHLDGTIFIDHTLKDNYKLYRLSKNQNGEESFAEIKNV